MKILIDLLSELGANAVYRRELFDRGIANVVNRTEVGQQLLTSVVPEARNVF